MFDEIPEDQEESYPCPNCPDGSMTRFESINANFQDGVLKVEITIGEPKLTEDKSNG